MAGLKDDETAQNDLNIKLHGQPWYQEFLRSQGQDPQRVKLNDNQRTQLRDLAAKNGVMLPDGVQFDPSGNVNEQHGFAGQPGWAKALEIGGAVAGADILSGGALHAPLMSAAHSIGGFGSSVIPGAGSGGGTGLMSSMSKLIPAAGEIISGMSKQSAQNRNAENNNRLTYDQLALKANDDARTRERLAMRDLLLSRGVQNYGNAGMQAPTNPFLRPVTVPGADRMGIASQLQGQAQGEFDKGFTPAITPYDQLKTKPGLFERIGGIVGPGLSIFGKLAQMNKQNEDDSQDQ